MALALAHHNAMPWDAWLDAIMGLPAPSLNEDLLFQWARRLRVDGGLLAPHVRFNSQSYHRSILWRSPRFEAVVLCWEAGQATAVHDHARSFGVSLVHEGCLAVRHYACLSGSAASGQAHVQPTAEAWVGAGTWMLDRVGTIHSLHNPAELATRCISLHLYAGPLDRMHLYHLENDAVTVKEMKAADDLEGS